MRPRPEAHRFDTIVRRGHTRRVAGAITFIVIGALASLGAGLLADANLDGRWAWLNLRAGSVPLDIVTSTSCVLPTLAAIDLTEGHAVWIRLIWIVVAFLGCVLLFVVPLQLRKGGTTADATDEDEASRHPIRKRRGRTVR